MEYSPWAKLNMSPKERRKVVTANVYDTKTDEVHSTHPTYKKAVNAMEKLNREHEDYDTPGNIKMGKFGVKSNSDVGGYAKGGDIDLKKCKVSTHEKCKSCKDW